MVKVSKKPELSMTECRRAVSKFFEKQTELKEIQVRFNELKSKFNSDMEDFFNLMDIEKSITFDYNEINESSLTISRIQKTSVEFDPYKLEKALGKELSKQVIVKRYEITDMDALISYLKECDVDPKIFKSFLTVSKEVDTKELDRLEELGKVTTEQVQGCYTIKSQKPYFTVKKVRDNGETEW